MTWLEHHRRSEQTASEAEMLALRGDLDQARHLYAQAAEAEAMALEILGPDKPRTLGITAVSAVALYFKANEWSESKLLAHRYLGTGQLPCFAIQQLEELIDANKLRQSGVVRDQILVSAKGGEVSRGAAPWDLVVPQMQRFVNLLHRTTELIQQIPHRKRGSPSNEIQGTYKPWIHQTEPGSFQFAVSLQDTRQLSLLRENVTTPAVVERLYDILDACANSPEDRMSRVVADDEYAMTFLKLARDLAPTPKGRFSQLNIRIASSDEPIVLNSATRGNLNNVIKANKPTNQAAENIEIPGVLRALHLNDDWIAIADHVSGKISKIERASEEVDDRIGPMVNQPVVVQVEKVGDRLNFVDIELDD